MAIFDDTVPADSEAQKKGAERIRETKTTLNSLLSQIFNDSLAFLTKWVTGAMIQNDSSDNSLRAIGSDHIKNSVVITRTLADAVLSADTTGRAKMADGFLKQNHLAGDFSLPNDFVTEAMLGPLSVTAGKIGSGAVTVPKAGTGVAKIAVGTYSGSDSVSAVVSGLAFDPDLIVITSSGKHNTLIAFRQEASGPSVIGSAHTLWQSGDIGSPYLNSIQWTSGGFTVIPFNVAGLNNNGETHSYVAIKV